MKNGSHVYYVNKQGTSGYLDLDNIHRYGPEHYYVACETLETGSYRVGVNYFKGSSAETAKIQITTSDGNTRSFSKSLANAVGAPGNNSPLIVATIVVSKDKDGKYSYEVN